MTPEMAVGVNVARSNGERSRGERSRPGQASLLSRQNYGS